MVTARSGWLTFWCPLHYIESTDLGVVIITLKHRAEAQGGWNYINNPYKYKGICDRKNYNFNHTEEKWLTVLVPINHQNQFGTIWWHFLWLVWNLRMNTTHSKAAHTHIINKTMWHMEIACVFTSLYIISVDHRQDYMWKHLLNDVVSTLVRT